GQEYEQKVKNFIHQHRILVRKIQYWFIFVHHLTTIFEKVMRVDKYLWCVRYYKTRNIGTEACKKNQVTVNGNIAKPSKEVLPGDTVTLRKDQITRVLVVLDIPANRVGPKLVDTYRKDETPAEALAHLEMLRLSRD